MMKYQNVIFDLDGTLLDTIDDLTAGVNRTMREFGYPEYTQQEVQRMVGNGIRRLLMLAVPGGERNEQFEAAYSFFTTYYTAHCREKTKPYAGILSLLTELKAAGIKLAIVSNKNAQAVSQLASVFFEGLITVAIGQSAQTHRKPAPDTVVAAMQQLGAAGKNTLYVGDSEVDKMTADNAGLDCALVTWGFRARDALEALKPAVLVDEPAQLISFVKNNQE